MSPKFKAFVLSICLSLVCACQMVPDETDEHLFVQLTVDGSYTYEGKQYDAKQLSLFIKSQFLAGEVPSRKIEIHCLKYLNFLQMGDLSTFSRFNIKPVDTKDFYFKSECSGDDITWTFGN